LRIDLEFPGGLRVDARFGSHRVATDQSVAEGGAASAPSPFAYFLTSLATCAGYYALQFCRTRGIDDAGLAVSLETEAGPEGALARVSLAVTPPPALPERYRAAFLRAIDQCTVKRFLAAPAPVEIWLDRPLAPEPAEEPALPLPRPALPART